MKRAGTFVLLGGALAAAGWVLWTATSNRRFNATPEALLQRLPTQNATVLSIDFASLRAAGILKLFAGNARTEEPEYVSFVKSSGFDYQKDLDQALISFAPDGTFFLIRGRFDWDRLTNYAKENGGSCYDRLCRLPGSKPERRISFLRLRPDVMGLAVSADDLAAARLENKGAQRQIEVLRDPVWISIPSSALKETALLPAGTRMFASAVAGADRVTFALGPKVGNGSFAARLEAVCGSPGEAQAMAAKLEKLTSAMKQVIGKGKSSDDLTSLLIAGTFKQSEKKVFGYWPVRKQLLENLTGGT